MEKPIRSVRSAIALMTSSWTIYTVVLTFCCTVWAIAVQAVVPAVSANAAIIGALMVLTPGVALTMGVRDILNGDYLSGSIRLLDALLIAGSIAGGVVLGWIVARGLGVT